MYRLIPQCVPATTGTFILITALLTGCAGTGGMVESTESIAPESDEATVVFMRSSFYGSAVSASVFDVTGEEAEFIGVVQNDTKVAHGVSPGEHVFMVVGEAADFMKANVQAGRTYYALVTPRMGAWKARFSFRPLRQEDLDGEDFADWDGDTTLVEPSEEAFTWARNNAPDIEAKRARFWPEWQSKEQHQRDSQTLNPEDGR